MSRRLGFACSQRIGAARVGTSGFGPQPHLCMRRTWHRRRRRRLLLPMSHLQAGCKRPAPSPCLQARSAALPSTRLWRMKRRAGGHMVQRALVTVVLLPCVVGQWLLRALKCRGVHAATAARQPQPAAWHSPPPPGGTHKQHGRGGSAQSNTSFAAQPPSCSCGRLGMQHPPLNLADDCCRCYALSVALLLLLLLLG